MDALVQAAKNLKAKLRVVEDEKLRLEKELVGYKKDILG